MPDLNGVPWYAAPDPRVDARNMVTQPHDIQSDAVLCVRCGWEAISCLPRAPWITFREHVCESPCGATYGQNPDPCVVRGPHDAHTNMYGTTWRKS